MTSGGNNFNHFAENQLTKFSARDVGDFSDVAFILVFCEQVFVILRLFLGYRSLSGLLPSSP